MRQRQHSQIYGLRTANNAAVSILFQAVKHNNQNHRSRGLDLGCGQGGALRKFRYCAGITYYDGIDIAPASVEECRNRAQTIYREHEMRIEKGDLQFERTWTWFPRDFYDLIYSGFNLHYFSDTDEHLETFVQRVSCRLRAGTGQWIVTTIDWPTLSSYLLNNRNNNNTKWENAVCRIELISSFSYKFTLLDRVQTEIEYAVRAPTLIRLAARYGLGLKRHVKLNELLLNASMTSDEEDVFALYVAYMFEKEIS